VFVLLIFVFFLQVRQEAVQQALAAMQDKPKPVLPLPSKRASVAPPSAHLQDEEDESTSDEDEGEEGGGGSIGNLLVETRNLALGLSDTSSTGSLASGPARLPPPPVPGDENPPPAVLNKPLPPSPKTVPPATSVSAGSENAQLIRQLSRDASGGEGGSDSQSSSGGGLGSQQHQLTAGSEAPPVRRRREERQRQDSDSRPLPPPVRDSQIEATHSGGGQRLGGSGGRNPNHPPASSNINNNNRIKRSSLIETQTKSNPTADLLQNIEPYDVLFLSGDLPPKLPPPSKAPPPPILSSMPDVALLPSSSSRHPGGPLPPPPLPPPLPHTRAGGVNRHSSHIGSVRINTGTSSKYSHPGDCQSAGGMDPTGTNSRWKVSAKIQQLLNTLKKPKRRPLPEFYEDDDVELEMAANNKDPNAPAPEGSTMSPAVGPQLVVPAGLPRSLEAAIQRYGSATYKAPVATVLDPNGKLSITLSYGKLWSRSLKIAYALLNKIGLSGGGGNKDAGGGGSGSSGGGGGVSQVKPGDRIALVYPNNDPLNMICAFYGCVMAGAVPVPIEVPMTRRDAGSAQIGFLLGSCGVSLALTSEACFKGLPKAANGEVLQFKAGWQKSSSIKPLWTLFVFWLSV
jgi:hypothetical protein